MKRVKSLVFLAALGLIHMNLTYAAGSVSGARVTYAGLYGNGSVYVGLDKAINEPSCTKARLDVPAGPQAKTVLATAYLALTSGKTVVVRSIGCSNGQPTLDNSYNSYFYIAN